MKSLFGRSRILQQMYKDQEGIFRRYLREKSHWDAHLQRTQKYLLRHLRGNKNSSLAVLGSGWLLDIPLEALIKRFYKIYLVDIRHPRQVQKKYSKHPRVVFITSDITGGAAAQVQEMQKGRITAANADFNARHMLQDFPDPPDIWASVNVLNQLDMLLASPLKKKFSQQQVMALRKRIQQDHLDFLRNRQAVLITDYHQLLLDDKGNLKEEQPLVHVPIPHGHDRQEWIWKFDTQKTYHRHFQTHFKVVAQSYLA